MNLDLEFDITPDQFQAVRQSFANNGVNIPDETQGEIEQQGVKARFTYDGQTLRINVYAAPWWMPEFKVRQRLTDFVQDALV